MSAKKEIAISRRFLLVGVVVLIAACLLLVGGRRCNPKGTEGDTVALSPTPAPTRMWWQAQAPSPSSPSTGSGRGQVLTLKARVTAEALNVREGPGSDYKVLGQVHRGDVVEILAQNSDGSWYKIQFAVRPFDPSASLRTGSAQDGLGSPQEKLVGWVSAAYVEMIAQAVRPFDPSASLRTGSAQDRQGSPQAVAMAPASGGDCLCPCPCTPTPTTAVVIAPTPTKNPAPTPRPTGVSPTPVPTGDGCPPDICTPPVRIVTPTPGTTPPPTPSPTLEEEVVIEVICEEVPQPAYGINVALLVEPGIRQRALDRVAELGFNWVKVQIRWLDFEASKGQYTQSLQWLDQAVNNTHARGFNIMLTVVGAPDWARAPGADPSTTAPPANPQDYADFLVFLADRYYGKVQAFEIWNEQNLAREWGGRGRMNVGEYMELLRASYNSLRMINAGVAVVSGGLTPTGTDDGLNAISDRRYLREMYAAGLKDVTNGIGAHASGYNLPPFADWQNPPRDQCLAFEHTCTNPHPSWVFQQTLLDYHDIMVEFGETKKQIWVTEFGWASCEGGIKAQEGYKYCEDNTGWEQGEWLREAYMGVKERGWTWVGILFTWNLNFAELSGPDSEMSAFSILDLNGQPRHAFEALKSMPKW